MLVRAHGRRQFTNCGKNRTGIYNTVYGCETAGQGEERAESQYLRHNVNRGKDTNAVLAHPNHTCLRGVVVSHFSSCMNLGICSHRLGCPVARLSHVSL